jgi:hypothetical protein
MMQTLTHSALALAFRRTAELTIRGGGKPYSNVALMPTERMGPPPGASPPMRMTAVGRQNFGKSTSSTTEPRERPMHHATTLPVPQRTCSRGDCATLFVSLELSRSTWVATALAPGSSKMSKHTLVGGNGRERRGCRPVPERSRSNWFVCPPRSRKW